MPTPNYSPTTLTFYPIPSDILLGSTLTLTWSTYGDFPQNITLTLVALAIQVSGSGDSNDGIELGSSLPIFDEPFNWTNASPLGQYVIRATCNDSSIDFIGLSNNFTVVSDMDTSVNTTSGSISGTSSQPASSLQYSASGASIYTPSISSSNPASSESFASTKTHTVNIMAIELGAILGGLAAVGVIFFSYLYVSQKVRRKRYAKFIAESQISEPVHDEPFLADNALANQDVVGTTEPEIMEIGIDSSSRVGHPTVVRLGERTGAEIAASLQAHTVRMNEMQQAIARLELQLQQSSPVEASAAGSETRSENVQEMRHRMSNLQTEVERLQELIREQSMELPPGYESYVGAALIPQTS